MKQNVALDASFWINISGLSFHSFLKDYFRLFVCGEVEREILYPITDLKIEPFDAAVFSQWVQEGAITRENPTQFRKTFQVGESQAISLAREKGYVLLIDDSNPYNYARKVGIKVVGSPDFAVFLFSQGRLDFETASNRLRMLEGRVKRTIVDRASQMLTLIREGGE